jgi:predicted CXXCH cytochrome family protein
MIASKHDLSVTGPGQRASGELGVCVFCHAPHTASAQPQLWNRRIRSLTYKLYSSSTLIAQLGQPTGSSKMCLSCHDGTIALGEIMSRPMIPPGLSRPLRGRPNLETDLSDDHPISFPYDAILASQNPELVNPALLGAGPVRLEKGEMQCISCHEPHYSVYPKMLVVDPANSALCVECHDKVGWSGSSHDSSEAGWNSSGADPWPYTEFRTVSENGCLSCHATHAAGYPERLLVWDTEEGNCLACHNGNVATTDIAAELAKGSAHRVWQSLRVHDPAEAFDSMQRHVECQDCHNPHAATRFGASAPYVSGSLASVAGVTSEGAETPEARFEYEICLRCHSRDSTIAINREVLQPDKKLQFDLSNASYHPVMGPGKNPDVPSLLTGWTDASYVYCTDCHANDQGPGAGASGPKGPHGSNWPFLLERQYATTDGATENLQRYALCYKCHSRASILNDDSFPSHLKHVRDYTTSCATCHDPHGVSLSQASAGDSTHLINFAVDEVVPNAAGELFFEDLGVFAGSCSLSCHNFEHDDLRYQR